MCFMCDQDAKANIASSYWGERLGFSRLHFQEAAAAAAGKFADGMMLTGHDLVPPQLPTVIITVDQQPGDTSTTATLTVGATPTISSLETIGDQDFFKVTLTAGQAYEIGQYAYVGGPNLTPLADAYVEVYDSLGNLIVSSDGGAPTVYNNLNSGFDVLLTFTPETSGTFYVNARSYDQEPLNGTDGDFVGDYEVFVREQAPGGYTPYYDPDSPLYSIDWGSQVDGSSRNPDGAEGPRPTGNEFTGHAWNPYGITGKNVITYYFARQGEIFIDEDPTTPGTTDTIVASGFEQWEKDVYLNAFGAYSKVADIVYVEVERRSEADFVLITYEGTPGPGASLLGRMSPPDEENEGRTEFNANDERWTEEGLAPGGFSFTTLIHEFGHGHGLAHPHDNGGRSGIMRGVESDGVAFSYTNGDFDLNQSVYTMMSYEDGWETSPYGSAETTDPYGWLGSLMAFDVAAIQDKYGVNEEFATGNDSYVLKDVNAAGTFYSCIWDAAGTDTISYSGNRSTNIDLRPASLIYDYGGGGWISYAFGIYGGFTIANGVTIENAISGAGNDVLIGNDADNALFGGGGSDAMTGGLGNDRYYVDNLGDTVSEAVGGGNDTVYASLSYTLAAGQEIETLATINNLGTSAFNLTGNELNNYIVGNLGNNVINGGAGRDYLDGRGGNDNYVIDNVDDVVIEAAGGGNDAAYAGVSWTLSAGASVEMLATFNNLATTAIDLTGNELNDYIIGNAGVNTLNGGLGADYLDGRGGADTYAFTSALGGGNVDALLSFDTGSDKIALDDAVFTGLGLGALPIGAFRTGPAAADIDDRIIYDSSTGALFFDADGNGTGAAVQFASLSAGLSLGASDFAVI